MAAIGKATRPIVAGIVSGLVDPLIQKGARQLGLNVSDDIIRILGGVVLMQTRFGNRGIVKDVLQAQVILGSAGLARGGFSALGFNGTNGSTTTTTTTDQI